MQSDAAHSAHSIHFRLTFIVVTRYKVQDDTLNLHNNILLYLHYDIVGVIDTMYRVTAINVSRKWIEWAEWAASLCPANSPFPGHVYCRHPVQTA